MSDNNMTYIWVGKIRKTVTYTPVDGNEYDEVTEWDVAFSDNELQQHLDLYEEEVDEYTIISINLKRLVLNETDEQEGFDFISKTFGVSDDDVANYQAPKGIRAGSIISNNSWERVVDRFDSETGMIHYTYMTEGKEKGAIHVNGFYGLGNFTVWHHCDHCGGSHEVQPNTVMYICSDCGSPNYYE